MWFLIFSLLSSCFALVCCCSSPSTWLCVLHRWPLLYAPLFASFQFHHLPFLFLDNKTRTSNKMPHWRNENTKNYKLDIFSNNFLHCPKLTSYCIFHNSATKRSTKDMRCSLCHEVVTKCATQFSITSIKE